LSINTITRLLIKVVWFQLDDDLKTIKTYLHHAALKQGLSQQTRVTAFADGAITAGLSSLSWNLIAKL